jgi:hypothetical protein
VVARRERGDEPRGRLPAFDEVLGSLQRLTGPNLSLVAFPSVIQDAECCIEHRIGVAGHEQLDVEREPGERSDFVAGLL